MKDVLIKKIICLISLLFRKRRRYYLYYSRQKRLLWYMIPKNASRTIKYHLEIACPDFVYLGYIPIIKRFWQNYKKFAVTRNPTERLLSAYRDKVINRKNMTEDEYWIWVSMQDGETCDPHIRNQDYLYDKEFVDIVVDINCLDQLFSFLDINISNLEHINRTKYE